MRSLPTAPVRARTIVAMCASSVWGQSREGSRFAAPMVDHLGTPILLVDQVHAEWVLGLGRLSTSLTPSPRLGSLQLTGWPRPTRAEERSGTLSSYLREHGDCGTACGAIGTVPIAVEITRVRLADPGTRAFATTSTVDFSAAAPDHLLTRTHAVAQHLNDEHGPDLVALAAAVTGRDRATLLGASIQLIDTEGVALTVIDEDGADDVEVDFDQPLAGVEELGPHLHRLLRDPAAYRQG